MCADSCTKKTDPHDNNVSVGVLAITHNVVMCICVQSGKYAATRSILKVYLTVMSVSFWSNRISRYNITYSSASINNKFGFIYPLKCRPHWTNRYNWLHRKHEVSASIYSIKCRLNFIYNQSGVSAICMHAEYMWVSEYQYTSSCKQEYMSVCTVNAVCVGVVRVCGGVANPIK